MIFRARGLRPSRSVHEVIAGGNAMRTAIACLCALGLLSGCERRSDRTAEADLDRSGADTMTTAAIPADSAANPALQWGPAPPGLPAGGRIAVLDGDPTKAGAFTIRLEAPQGYEVRPHHHPTSEKVRVIEGAFSVGHGKQWEEGKLAPLAVGTELDLAANEPHFVRATERSIVEIRSEGPFEITYENPSDDPRKAPIQ
jgi:hypothetical protein